MCRAINLNGYYHVISDEAYLALKYTEDEAQVNDVFDNYSPHVPQRMRIAVWSEILSLKDKPMTHVGMAYPEPPPEGYEERRQALLLEQKEQPMTRTPEALKMLKERAGELLRKRNGLNHGIQVTQNRLDDERIRVEGSQRVLAKSKAEHIKLCIELQKLEAEIALLENN